MSYDAGHLLVLMGRGAPTVLLDLGLKLARWPIPLCYILAVRKQPKAFGAQALNGCRAPSNLSKHQGLLLLWTWLLTL